MTKAQAIQLYKLNAKVRVPQHYRYQLYTWGYLSYYGTWHMIQRSIHSKSPVALWSIRHLK